MIKHKLISGFTLLEVMIAVAIAGVVAAFAFPAFDYTIQNNQVKTAASDIHINLLQARSEAIKRNDDVDVNLNTNGWTVTYNSATISEKNDLSTDVNYDCYLDSTLETLPKTVTFKRTGRPDKLLELRFTSNELAQVPLRCVTVSLSGRPKVVTDSDSDPTNGCN